MERLIINYNNKSYKVILTENCTSIEDSFKVKRIKDMKNILKYLKSNSSGQLAINKRSLFSMINEWRVHNLLYFFGIKKDRTKTVDLDIGQPLYMKIAYTVLSLFYWNF